MDQNRQDYKRLRGPHYTAKAEYIVVETKLRVLNHFGGFTIW
jgi:hypothetical protein